LAADKKFERIINKIESIATETSTNSSVIQGLGVYTYQISAYRYGGEHTIETIPRKVALWWMQNHPDDFEDYFLQEDKTHHSEDNWGHIPEEYRLGEWYENHDEILHYDCCEFSDNGWIEVYLIDKTAKKNAFGNRAYEEVANIKFDDIEDDNQFHEDWKSSLPETNPDFFKKIYPDRNGEDGEYILPELCVVYGQRIFKGGWDFYRFTTDHKFDASKLIFTAEQFEDSQLLTGFKYEDEEITLFGSNGDHKWDRAWIDDYLLD
jgi:hypothetical protein